MVAYNASKLSEFAVKTRRSQFYKNSNRKYYNSRKNTAEFVSELR